MSPTVSQMGLVAAICVCIGIIHHSYASRPVLGYRAIELTPELASERVRLMELQPGERVETVHHVRLTNHGDCYTLRWVCDQEPAADDYRPLNGHGARTLFAPACSTPITTLSRGDVRVWNVRIRTANMTWTETIYDQPSGTTARNERELPICSYGGMPEGL
jgi:hypothetical protein